MPYASPIASTGTGATVVSTTSQPATHNATYNAQAIVPLLELRVPAATVLTAPPQLQVGAPSSVFPSVLGPAPNEKRSVPMFMLNTIG